MAFVRILLMNLLFRGPLRVFFGVPAGAVFGFLFCAAGGIVPAALMAPGAGALWLWRREDPNRNDRKKEGAAEMPLLLRYGGTFRWGETARRAFRPSRNRRSSTAAAAPLPRGRIFHHRSCLLWRRKQIVTYT